MVKVELVDISKKFKDSYAINNISLTINEGEIFSLLGPSGSGKTTLLRVIAGLEKPDSGKVLFDGKDITHLPPNKRNIGMVFQDYGLWPHMTVYENIKFVLKGREMSGLGNGQVDEKAVIEKVLSTVHLLGKKDKRPSEISGGEQQRVALARALAIKPNLLLMDEPLSNLDAKIREELIVEMLAIIRETNITTVYVTHDQSEAFQLSERIGLINQGNIVQMSTPKELYRNPVNSFAASFIGNNLTITGKISSMMNDLVEIMVPEGQISFRPPQNSGFSVGKEVSITARIRELEISRDKTQNSLKVKVLGYRFIDGQDYLFVQFGSRIIKLQAQLDYEKDDYVYLKLIEGKFRVY